VHLGGDSSEESRHISPTILKGVTWDDKVMGEEIFGPILPVLVYDDLDSIIAEINKRPKPLACYVFSENKNFQEKVMNSISFGGGCINDTISHVATPHMPFGGVGNSGIGGYHGKESYLTFSHGKSILKKSTKIDVPLAFPPYGGRIKLIRWVMGR